MYVNSKKRRNNFTIVELMVVIAVLAVLLSLLQPTLNRTLEVAETTQCSSNLKSLATVFQVYAEDYNGNHLAHLRGVKHKWGSQFQNDYGVTADTFICSATKLSNNPNQFFGNASTQWGNGGISANLGIGNLRGSYSRNVYLSQQIYTPADRSYNYWNRFTLRDHSEVNHPNLTPLVFDGSWYISWHHSGVRPPASASTTLKGSAISRHGWSMNLAMSDGSVNNHILEDLWTKFYWRRGQSPRKLPPTINP